jgi:phosphoglycolate phosphatase
MSVKAAIFDLDGTLLDTLEDIACSANRVLAERGFATHDLADYRYFVGDGVEVLMSRVLPVAKRDDETMAACVAAFRDDYRRNWNVKTKPYAGVPAMLDGVTKRGLKLAVLSNKPDDFTKLCVRELLRDWRFEMVVGALEGVPRKPHPGGAKRIAKHLNIAETDIIYLGDTAIDMETATAAGMCAVGALWGFRTRDELQDSGAQFILERPEDLLSLV